MGSQADLIDQIDWKEVECLNANPEHTVNNALKQGYREDDGLFLESDTDEQLLLHIPFQTAVKLQSITIKSIKDKDRAPRHVRLFINRPTLGFGDAADLAAAQELELSESDLEGNPIQLKIVKFNRVNVLSLFFASNHGDEETTIIQKIALTGSSGETFNVNEIKKAGDEDKQ